MSNAPPPQDLWVTLWGIGEWNGSPAGKGALKRAMAANLPKAH